MTQFHRVTASVLVGSLGLLVCIADRATQARPLTERTLSLVIGSDPAIKGSGAYDCVNAQIATNNNYTRNSTCVTYNSTTIPTPARTCIDCRGAPSASGSVADPNGKPIVKNAQIDCSKTQFGPSVFWTSGNCVVSMASRVGTCDGNDTPQGVPCNVGFAQFTGQRTLGQ